MGTIRKARRHTAKQIKLLAQQAGFNLAEADLRALRSDPPSVAKVTFDGASALRAQARRESEAATAEYSSAAPLARETGSNAPWNTEMTRHAAAYTRAATFFDALMEATKGKITPEQTGAAMASLVRGLEQLRSARLT